MNVLVVDDHSLIAEGFGKLIESFVHNCESYVALNAAGAIDMVRRRPFALAFIDARLPGTDGMELIGILRNESPATKLVCVTSFGQIETVFAVLQAKPDGVLLKASANAEILKICIDTVLEGKKYQSPAIKQMLDEFGYDPGRTILKFSKRELELLELLCKGLSSKEIAEILNLSHFTVDAYRKEMLQKAKCKNVAELTAFALSNGLI